MAKEIALTGQFSKTGKPGGLLKGGYYGGKEIPRRKAPEPIALSGLFSRTGKPGGPLVKGTRDGVWKPQVGEKVLYGNRPCTVRHVYDYTADLKTEDGFKLQGILISKMKPYSSANDSVRKAPARLHRALDRVMDARRVKDDGESDRGSYNSSPKVRGRSTCKNCGEPIVNRGGWRHDTSGALAICKNGKTYAEPSSAKDSVPQDCLDLGTLAL